MNVPEGRPRRVAGTVLCCALAAALWAGPLPLAGQSPASEATSGTQAWASLPIGPAARLVASAGLGGVWGNRVVECPDLCWFGEASREPFPATPAVMLEALAITDVGQTELGVGLHGSLNGEEFFAVVALTVVLGRRR